MRKTATEKKEETDAPSRNETEGQAGSEDEVKASIDKGKEQESNQEWNDGEALDERRARASLKEQSDEESVTEEQRRRGAPPLRSCVDPDNELPFLEDVTSEEETETETEDLTEDEATETKAEDETEDKEDAKVVADERQESLEERARRETPERSEEHCGEVCTVPESGEKAKGVDGV